LIRRLFPFRYDPFEVAYANELVEVAAARLDKLGSEHEWRASRRMFSQTPAIGDEHIEDDKLGATPRAVEAEFFTTS
jgi:hypothetical protein